jgi:ubiquinone/menaquinone biosynthesis C-methylase UbiE
VESGFQRFLRRCGGVELAWRLVRKEIGKSGGLRILEAGCGTGELSLRLARLGNSMILIDTSRSALECARKASQGNAQATLVQASLFNLPFKPGVFDRTFNVGVLDHFSAEGRREALGEMLRVLRGDGCAVVLTNDARSFIHPIAMRHAIKKGRWPFGFKDALTSLRNELNLPPDLIAREYTRGFISQFEFLHYFLPENRTIRKIFSRVFFAVTLPFSFLNRLPGQYVVTVIDKRDSKPI